MNPSANAFPICFNISVVCVASPESSTSQPPGALYLSILFCNFLDKRVAFAFSSISAVTVRYGFWFSLVMLSMLYPSSSEAKSDSLYVCFSSSPSLFFSVVSIFISKIFSQVSLSVSLMRLTSTSFSSMLSVIAFFSVVVCFNIS